MSQKIKLGVVGLGIGRSHVNNFKKDPRVDMVAICDPDEARLSKASEHFGVPKTFTDAHAMFKSGLLDAVSIAVPNCFHCELTQAAFKEGLHVLCEKPMAMSIPEAEAMDAAALSAGKKLMINFSFRNHPSSLSLKAAVEAGVVGDIYSGRTVWHRRRGLPGFGGWFGQKKMSGGGPLIDLGVHRLDLAMWLMGSPDPISVSGATYDPIARAEAERQGKKFDVEDLAIGFIRFANGASLIIEASWALNQPLREDMCTQLYGTKGGLVQRNLNEGYDFEAELYLEQAGSHYTQRLDIPAGANRTSQTEFIDAILEDREPNATGQQGIKVQKVLEGLYQSAETGREVRFDDNITKLPDPGGAPSDHGLKTG